MIGYFMICGNLQCRGGLNDLKTKNLGILTLILMLCELVKYWHVNIDYIVFILHQITYGRSDLLFYDLHALHLFK